MSKKLQCADPECPSRVGGAESVFTANLSVDENGELCTDVHKLGGRDFVCCYCEAYAEWVEKEST